MEILTLAGYTSGILNNSRDIYVYLPPRYEQEPARTYPVLYIHDGQNVFSPAFNGQSWNLHKTCDRLIGEKRIEDIIIVAVANAAGDRNSEFAHSGPHEKFLDYPCHGERYERFLTEELKPHIDRLFRTRTGKEDTALMGSSRGGLVTYHIGFRCPDVFGKLAIVSPYFSQYEEATMTHRSIRIPYGRKGPSRIWIDTGGMEGMTVLRAHVWEAVDHLLQLGYHSGSDLAYYYDPAAAHDESAWAERAHLPLLYLFGLPSQVTSIDLQTPLEIGLAGSQAYVNAVKTYENGLKMTDLEGDLRLLPPEAGSIGPTGLVKPGKAGPAAVQYRVSGLAAVQALEVVPELPAAVRVAIEVSVPIDTPQSAKIYAGFELYRENRTLYKRVVTLPRDAGFAFRISEFGGLAEADEAGRVVTRQFRADQDLVLCYEVKRWVQGNRL